MINCFALEENAIFGLEEKSGTADTKGEDIIIKKYRERVTFLCAVLLFPLPLCSGGEGNKKNCGEWKL